MIDVSGISGGASSAAGNDEKARQELGQKDFLKLMTTQLKNQDPMSPMKNADFMAQMAQFTAASGIQDLNESFGSFSQSMQTNQALEAASLVGRDVVVDTDTGYLPAQGDLTGTAVLPSGVDNLTVLINDSRGQTVQKLELGRQPAGEAAFRWDGTDANGNRLPAGDYRISAQSEVDGEPVAQQTRVNANVNSVTLSGAGEPPRLNLEGLGELSLSAVRQVK